MTLTKQHITESIQGQLKISKNASYALVENLLEIIKNTLASGEDMMPDARRVVTFQWSGKLRDQINDGGG